MFSAISQSFPNYCLTLCWDDRIPSLCMAVHIYFMLKKVVCTMTSVWNEIHAPFWGTQAFVFGSGTIDYVAKGTNVLLVLVVCTLYQTNTACIARPAVGCNSALSPVQGLLPRSDCRKIYQTVCTGLWLRRDDGKHWLLLAKTNFDRKCMEICSRANSGIDLYERSLMWK